MYHDFRRCFPEMAQAAEARHVKIWGSVETIRRTVGSRVWLERSTIRWGVRIKMLIWLWFSHTLKKASARLMTKLKTASMRVFSKTFSGKLNRNLRLVFGQWYQSPCGSCILTSMVAPDERISNSELLSTDATIGESAANLRFVRVLSAR